MCHNTEHKTFAVHQEGRKGIVKTESLSGQGFLQSSVPPFLRSSLLRENGNRADRKGEEVAQTTDERTIIHSEKKVGSATSRLVDARTESDGCNFTVSTASTWLPT